MHLKPVRTVAKISGPAAEDCMDLIRHGLDRLGHREHSGGLSALLLGRTVSCDPLSGEPVLLLVQRELLRALAQVLVSATAEVRPKAPMSLGRHVPGNPFIGIDVEQNPPVLGREIAPFRRGWGMHEAALSVIAHERLRELRADLAVRIATFSASGGALLVVRALELVVAPSLSVQVFKGRRTVVRRWCVDAHHSLLAVTLVPWPKLQSRDTLVVYADEMQPTRRHVD
ncbi:MAG: hypothetical protein A3G21_13975 [Acidobacteria bacterium RIFCSPLOWO2_12_FULL_66_21]|nr:MAG: hypothetical protein A3G21_13975 [Acidobacteria bacterium RIFCSPLOWO2_12_FULL_66_21]